MLPYYRCQGPGGVGLSVPWFRVQLNPRSCPTCAQVLDVPHHVARGVLALGRTLDAFAKAGSQHRQSALPAWCRCATPIRGGTFTGALQPIGALHRRTQ